MKYLLAVTMLAMLLGLTTYPVQVAAHDDATPDAGTPVDAGSLAGMLALLPALPLSGEGSPMVTYANVAAQLTAVGARAPGDLDDRTGFGLWANATMTLALPGDVSYMVQPEWREALGFDATRIDQSVEYSAPPTVVTVLRGRFDPAELHAAWERSGYQPVTDEGGTVFSIRGDFEIDLEDPISRMAMAHLNHIALIDDQTLVYSSAVDNVRRALEVAAGRQASFADQVEMAPLVMNVPVDLATALLVGGSALMSQGDPAAIVLQQTPGASDVVAIATQFAAESAESRKLPPIAAALLGQTAGGPLRSLSGDSAATPAGIPPARLVVALTMIHRDAAATAVPVIEERLSTGRLKTTDRAYDDLFPERQVRLAEAGPVVLIELSLGAETPPNILTRMLFQRDLDFLAWDF